MNPVSEVDRLLDQHGAVLIRQNKHKVYRLPNGRMFTRGPTPSDYRTPWNELSDLRRALGIPRESREMKGETAVPHSLVQSLAPTLTEESAKAATLKERLETAIAIAEQNQEKVLAEAQAVERRVNMLKALLPFADDPMIEEALLGLLPAPDPPQPESMAIVEPPEAISERVQVTRQLVFAATQTFTGTFTVNDVRDLMINGRAIEASEAQRVRSSIAGCMMALHERGELIRVAEHTGRKQALWRKAELHMAVPERADV